MTKPLGIILAGGQATRMGGGDKALLALGDQTLLQTVTKRFAPQVADVALNANGDPARFDFDGVVLADTFDSAGPLAGVLAGLEWANTQGADLIVTVAADTPFFPSDLVERLVDVSRGDDLVLAATQDTDRMYLQPTFGLWPVRLRKPLIQALEQGTRKVRQFTKAQNAKETVFDAAPYDPFFNINTPEDLAKAQAFYRDINGL